MKFCDDHWKKLKEAINARGMEGLVAKTGEQAIANTVAELEAHQKGHKPDPSTFDPLMSAQWAIVNNMMQFVGLLLMAPNEDGTDKCPLCFITAEHKRYCNKPGCKVENFDSWIDKAADEALTHAKDLGLVGVT